MVQDKQLLGGRLHQHKYVSLSKAELPDRFLEGFIDGHFCSRRVLHPLQLVPPQLVGMSVFTSD